MDAGHLQGEGVEARDLTGLAPDARSRRLRRIFWRRMAWLLAGLAAVVVVFAWQLGRTRRATCRTSLEHFARLAHDSDLASTPSQILTEQWAGLRTGKAGFPSSHFAMITFNWPLSVKGDEALPLAVCEKPHHILFKRGRHVLFRTTAGEKIEWLSGDEADEIFRSAETLAHPYTRVTGTNQGRPSAPRWVAAKQVMHIIASGGSPKVLQVFTGTKPPGLKPGVILDSSPIEQTFVTGR